MLSDGDLATGFETGITLSKSMDDLFVNGAIAWVLVSHAAAWSALYGTWPRLQLGYYDSVVSQCAMTNVPSPHHDCVSRSELAPVRPEHAHRQQEVAVRPALAALNDGEGVPA